MKLLNAAFAAFLMVGGSLSGKAAEAAGSARKPASSDEIILKSTPGSARLYATYEKCASKGNLTGDVEIWGDCGEQLVKGEEQLLRRTLAALLSIYPAVPRADLEREQAAWTTFKEQACSHWGNREWYGAISRNLVFPVCRATVIAERVRELQQIERWTREDQDNRD